MGGTGAREELDAADLVSAVASPARRRSCTRRGGSRRLGRRPHARGSGGHRHTPPAPSRSSGRAAAVAGARPGQRARGRSSGRARGRLPRRGTAARGRAKAASTSARQGRSGRQRRAGAGSANARHAAAPTCGHRQAVRRSPTDRKGRRRAGEGAGEDVAPTGVHRARHRSRCAATALPHRLSVVTHGADVATDGK